MFASLALGLLHAWMGRYSMNPDGMSYLDVGDSFFRRDWANAVNAWWSPQSCAQQLRHRIRSADESDAERHHYGHRGLLSIFRLRLRSLQTWPPLLEVSAKFTF